MASTLPPSAWAVQPGRLAQAAGTARLLAARLDGAALELDAAAGPLLAGADGWQSASAAGDAAVRWGALLDDEARQLRSLAQALVGAAGAYTSADAAVARGLRTPISG